MVEAVEAWVHVHMSVRYGCVSPGPLRSSGAVNGLFTVGHRGDLSTLSCVCDQIRSRYDLLQHCNCAISPYRWIDQARLTGKTACLKGLICYRTGSGRNFQGSMGFVTKQVLYVCQHTQ